MIAEQIAVLKTKSCTITLSGWIEALFFLTSHKLHPLATLKFWSEPSPFFMVGAMLPLRAATSVDSIPDFKD